MGAVIPVALDMCHGSILDLNAAYAFSQHRSI